MQSGAETSCQKYSYVYDVMHCKIMSLVTEKILRFSEDYFNHKVFRKLGPCSLAFSCSALTYSATNAITWVAYSDHCLSATLCIVSKWWYAYSVYRSRIEMWGRHFNLCHFRPPRPTLVSPPKRGSNWGREDIIWYWNSNQMAADGAKLSIDGHCDDMTELSIVCYLTLTPYHVVHTIVANAPKYSVDSHYICWLENLSRTLAVLSHNLWAFLIINITLCSRNRTFCAFLFIQNGVAF